MNLSTVIRALKDCGGTLEQIEAVTAAWDRAVEEKAERKAAGNRERQLRWRKNNSKIKALTPVTRVTVTGVTNGSPSSPLPEKDTPTPLEKQTLPPPPPPAQPGRARRMAPDMALTPDWLEAAAKIGLSADEAATEFEKFRDRHAAEGKAFVDWKAAWRTWCRNAIEIIARKGRGNGPKQSDNRSPSETPLDGAFQRLRGRVAGRNDHARGPNLELFPDVEEGLSGAAGGDAGRSPRQR